MKTVQVLMSTYNGATYLKEQLDSVLLQEGVQVHCLIRDDGSTDDTHRILEKYALKHKNIEVVYGDNIGYEASFMTLVSLSGDFDYYAFADQDDVWLPEKLKVAVEMLAGKAKINHPMMYYSNCELVDHVGKPIGMLRHDKSFIPQSETQAVVLGFVHGCTMVFNKASKELISQYKLNKNLAHDYWIPLLHVFMGECVYDDKSYIHYRQHSANTFGGGSNIQDVLKKQKRDFRKNSRKYSGVANELLQGYNDRLSDSSKTVLKSLSVTTLKGRLLLLFNKSLKRSTFRGTLYLKFLLLSSHF